MRDGFILHSKTIRMFDHMESDDVKYMISCLAEYAKTKEVDWGKIDTLSPIVAVAMEDAIERMDADMENYERLSKVRSDAGRKGAEKRWQSHNLPIAKMANDSKDMANDSRDIANDDASVSVYVLKEKDNTSYYPKRKEPLPLADCEALILNDGSEWKPTQDEFDEYKRLYPSVDIRQEFRSMRGWCSGNPTKRKTARGIKRFVTSWLSRSQDKPSRPSPNVKVEPRNYDMDDLERQLYAAQKG